jgi:hypothetical protein
MMKNKQFIGNETNLTATTAPKKRTFLTGAFAKGAALLLAGTVALGGCPGPTDPGGNGTHQPNGNNQPGGNNQPNGNSGPELPNGFTGNERVEEVWLGHGGIQTQELATINMEFALRDMLRQSQTLEAQYATLGGDTAADIWGIERNISNTLKETDKISTGRENMPVYAGQIVDILAPHTTNPDLFRKMVDAQRRNMISKQGAYESSQNSVIFEEWENLVAEINAIDAESGLDPNDLGPNTNNLVQKIAALIPTGENGAKFPTDIATQITDLYKFHSYTHSLMYKDGFDINLPKGRSVAK